MFGKGGGPLGAWIKEFCELVFIQTLQAFIFALVISFIVNILASQAAMDATDKNTSLGIICIVALTSIFKIEDIARRVFGYGNTKADHGNAVKSIGKTMLAFQMGKSLLDNGKKVVGGFGAMAAAHSDKVKELKRVRKRREALNRDNGSTDGNDNTNVTSLSTNSSSEGQRKIDSTKRNEKIELYNDAQKARRLASQEKDVNKRKALIAEATDKLNRAKNIDDTLVEATPSPNKNSNSSSGGGRIKDYNQRLLQIEEDHKKKMGEISKKRREGLKSMVSGATESGAAFIGFTSGSAMSAASNNDWGQAMSDGLTWAGAADKITSFGVDAAFDLEKFTGDRVKGARDMIDEYTSNAAKSIDKNIEKSLIDAKKEMESGLSRAAKTAKAVAKGTVQGLGTTYKNHSVRYQRKLNNQQLKDIVAKTDDKDTFR